MIRSLVERFHLHESRAVVGAYAYQFSNQLAQLLVIPILAKILPPDALVLAAKFFVSINFINIVTDWGYSTIGSQRLFRNAGNANALGAIFGSGEALRLSLWIVCCLVSTIGAVISNGLSREATNLSVVVVLGTLSWLLLPNWLIIGTRIYETVTPIVFVMRVLSITVLIALSKITGDVVMALTTYFATLCVFSFVVRVVARRRVGIVGRDSLRRFDVKNEIGSGLIIMIGTGCSFGFLNSGVFFVDRFADRTSAAAFVIADRLLASVRAAYAPLIQHVFVGIDKHSSPRHMPKPFVAVVIAGTLAVWASGTLLIRLVFHNPLAERYFDILIVGFFFLGFSHYYVTLRTLGGGFVFKWLQVLLVALGVYVAAIGTMLALHSDAAIGVSCAVIAAELTVFFYGFWINRTVHDGLRQVVLPKHARGSVSVSAQSASASHVGNQTDVGP